jgi:hypothetical protein
VGSAAGVAVAGCDFYQPNRARAVREFEKVTGRQQLLGFVAGDVLCGHRAVFADDFVHNPFHAFQAVVGQRPSGQINGRNPLT